MKIEIKIGKIAVGVRGEFLTKTSLGKKENFKEGLNRVSVEGLDEIVVAKIGDRFYAMRGLCNHQEGPLAEGELEGTVITCPWHGSKWDVTTGKLVDFPIALDDEPIYKVTIENGELIIEI